MQSFSRKTACAYGKYEQEIGFIFSEPEETGRKNATLQQENVKLRTELSKQERLNNTKRGSKRKRTESKVEVPVDLRVGLRTYFIALMLEEKLFIVRDQSLCLFFRADRVIACLQRRRHACVVKHHRSLQTHISCGHTTDFYLGKPFLPRANSSKIYLGKFISGFVLPR